jgi:hypothetical protein
VADHRRRPDRRGAEWLHGVTLRKGSGAHGGATREWLPLFGSAFLKNLYYISEPSLTRYAERGFTARSLAVNVHLV